MKTKPQNNDLGGPAPLTVLRKRIQFCSKGITIKGVSVRFIYILLISLFSFSCVRPSKLGGEMNKVCSCGSSDVITFMKLEFYDMNNVQAYCDLILAKKNKDLFLCYSEYNNKDLIYHRCIHLLESDVDKIMNKAMLIYERQPSTASSAEYSLGVSIHLTKRMPPTCILFLGEVWSYHKNVENSPSWQEFLDYFKHEFPEFELLLNEMKKYKHPIKDIDIDELLKMGLEDEVRPPKSLF